MQLELDIQSKSLSWKDNEVKISFYQNLAEKVVIKNENTEDLIELETVKKIQIDDNEDIIQNDHFINVNINVQSESQNVDVIEKIQNKDYHELINESTKLESPKSSLR